MLLCEVALGDVYSDNMFHLGMDDAHRKQVKKHHTLKILGRMRPNPIYSKTLANGKKNMLEKNNF